MKPFDLQAAKDGAELVTREGKPARILCYDFLRYEDNTKSSYREILTAIIDQDEKGTKFEMFACHETSGKATMVIPAMAIPDFEEKKYDLFIKEKKHEGYVAIQKSHTTYFVSNEVFNTKQSVIENNISNNMFVAAAKIEWEE